MLKKVATESGSEDGGGEVQTIGGSTRLASIFLGINNKIATLVSFFKESYDSLSRFSMSTKATNWIDYAIFQVSLNALCDMRTRSLSGPVRLLLQSDVVEFSWEFLCSLMSKSGKALSINSRDIAARLQPPCKG